MTTLRRLAHPRTSPGSDAVLEWLVTNGLGGYASGPVSGVMTRRHHGTLVSALPAPLGRLVMLSHVQAIVRLDSATTVLLDPGFAPSIESPDTFAELEEFRLELGLPVWRYRVDGFVIEKRVLMPHHQNTVHVSYQFIGATGRVHMELRPYMNFRHYESALSDAPITPYWVRAIERRFEIRSDVELPPLRLMVHGCSSALMLDGGQWMNPYDEERHRGYPHDAHVWSPGAFHLDLDCTGEGAVATLVASTEEWATVEALSPADATAAEVERRERLLQQAVPEARSGMPAELVLAADQFIITPIGRSDDAARATALGLEARTVIAGYHWFTDWGRDTMISLEGLTLTTGRHREAGYILRTFAHYVRDGLIPNMFPDGEREGLYHTADATLWFFHAVDRYLKITGDAELLKALLPTLRDIMAKHIAGTRFGIGVDPGDGLLRQGAEGYQLTWMDAKVDDWVVTPRRGKAVEINALFYNALRLLEGWVRESEGAGAASDLALRAARARESFNARFWYEPGGHLYDVVDGENGDDPACRPNQILALSLAHPVLAEERWRPVFDVVERTLLTPCGLRSLSPTHPDYHPKYYGDLRARDAAYHQGTVWGWLIGPFVDAWRRVAPLDEGKISSLLNGFDRQLNIAGVGSVSEVFDAEEPFVPRGCIAQAWSVAELLRVMSGPHEVA